MENIVDNMDTLNAKLAQVRDAQKIFASYTQEQVDAIFKAAAIAANQARIPLAKMAVEETGMGVVEEIRLSRTTMPPSTFTISTKMYRHVVLLRRISHLELKRLLNPSVS